MLLWIGSALLVAGGCGGGDPAAGDDSDPSRGADTYPPGDTDQPATGDGGEAASAHGLGAAVSEAVPTVITAHWSSVFQAGTLSYRSGDHSGSVEIRSPSLGKQVIVGMKPGRTYTLTLTDDGGDSESVKITTGSPPEHLPALGARSLDPAATWEGYLLTALLLQPVAVLLDSDGDYLWWYENPDYDLGGRTQLSADGRGVWTSNVNQFGEGFVLRLVSWEGELLEERLLGEVHHDWYEHPDGTLAALSRDPQPFGDREVSGDAVVEYGPGGDVRQIFSVWDAWTWPGDAGAGDVEWPHANALDYLPEEDAYLVSFLTIDGIARIDRATGAVQWVLGGDFSTLRTPGGGTTFFDGQHQMHWLDGSLLVFVNGLRGETSRAVELALDEEAGVATEAWSYTPDPPISSFVLGDVTRLGDGSTLVTFSFTGELQQVAPDGTPLWTLGPLPDIGLGYTTWLGSLTP